MPSHGSLTKAGKVRGQTPKIKGKPRKGLAPRMRNRVEYIRYLARQLAEEIVRRARREGKTPEQVLDEMIRTSRGPKKTALILIKTGRIRTRF